MFTRINELAAEVHADNHIWWHDLHTGERLVRNKGEMIALTHSELSEMAEAVSAKAVDDKLPHRMGEEVELADFVIRNLDYAGAHEIKISSVPISIGSMSKNDSIVYGHFLMSRMLESVRKNNAEGEAKYLSWALCWAQAHALYFFLDLDGAIVEKRAFNKTRPDHQREARLQHDGKQF